MPLCFSGNLPTGELCLRAKIIPRDFGFCVFFVLDKTSEETLIAREGQSMIPRDFLLGYEVPGMYYE